MRIWKSLLLSLIVILCLTVLYSPESHAVAYSGTCGTNLTWHIEDGTLTISGTGAMVKYNTSSQIPWQSYCDSIHTAVIEEGVTSIGNYTFMDCTNLSSVTIPSTVTSINYRAFGNCTGLTSIVIPDTVTYMGSDIFYGCSNLEALTVPFVGSKRLASNSPDYQYPFGYFFGTQSFPGASATFQYYYSSYPQFSNMTSYIPTKLTSVTVTDSTVLYAAFYGCSNLTEVTLGEGVTTISSNAFHNCTSLKTVSTSDNLIAIGTQCFYNCQNLTDLNLGNGLLNIDKQAFSRTGLTSVTLPNSLVQIKQGGFEHCSKLTSVTLPASLKIIGSSGFYGCTSLKDVYYTGSASQWQDISIGDYNTLLTGATIHYNFHDHRFTTYVPDPEATCTTDGVLTAKCDFCEVIDTQYVTAYGHSFSNYTSDNNATYFADGTKTARCDRCDETDTVTDPGSMLPMVAPAITQQPQSVTVESGSPARFTVGTQGPVISYRWQYKRLHVWFDTTMEGYDTATLVVDATGARNQYAYRCIVKFYDGTVLTTEAAVMTVDTTIFILESPKDQTVALSEKALFTTTAEGEGLVYHWQYKRPNASTWYYTAMEGCHTPTVLVEATPSRNGYQYRCEITDAAGKTVYTEPATLRGGAPTVIKTQPESKISAIGGTVQFSVDASNVYSYQWQYARKGSDHWMNTGLTGNNTDTLTVEVLRNRNGYQYRCVIKGLDGNTYISEAAILTFG